ncbi:MAG: hypothetical protein IT198_01090 [Acidimicrobiia bacterium]|nr:hypothetical protein [Acidimicrobiia bacterium]
MGEVDLHALEGTNPLGLLAAIGCLTAVARTAPDLEPTLRWTESVVPTALLDGPSDVQHLTGILMADLAAWTPSAVLDSGPGGDTIDEVKLTPDDLRSWITAVASQATARNRRDLDLLCGLVAEFALDNNGNAKPTDLHFAAGQQRFLKMARELREGMQAADYTEAIQGPWQSASVLPTFDWDCGSERVYALRAGDPSKEKKLGVAAANWLGFTSLSLLPVLSQARKAVTTGGGGSWKRGTFTWPLWSVPATVPVVRSLLSLPGLADMRPAELRARGMLRVLRSPIRRTDQGGYGSIGIPEVLVDAADAG